MENLCIFLASFHVIITVIVRPVVWLFFRRCSTWTREQIFNLQISSAAALQPFVRRAHQIVILHLPLPLPPAHPYLHLIHRKVRVPNTLLQILCIYHACGRIGFEIGVRNAPQRGKGNELCATRAAACGLGFSIKLFCGRSDNQTIVQYILFECLPSLFLSLWVSRVIRIALFTSASAYV